MSTATRGQTTLAPTAAAATGATPTGTRRPRVQVRSAAGPATVAAAFCVCVGCRSTEIVLGLSLPRGTRGRPLDAAARPPSHFASLGSRDRSPCARESGSGEGRGGGGGGGGHESDGRDPANAGARESRQPRDDRRCFSPVVLTALAAVCYN
jgi:hypothetical protein